MSYSRWSNSSWYAFYNVNGALSLWYSMDKTIDWEYDSVVDCLALDAPERNLCIIEIYACSEAEAIEAAGYMERYVEDYDPQDSEEYAKEVEAMLTKWEGMKDES
jgi:hypothetical protein